MLRQLVAVVTLGGALAVTTGSASAQVILPPAFPGGPITIINPDRINNPFSNIPLGGTTSSFGYWVPGLGWVSGTSYIGLDGKPHGTTVIPGGPGGGSVIHHYRKAGPASAMHRRPAGNSGYRTLPIRSSSYRPRR